MDKKKINVGEIIVEEILMKAWQEKTFLSVPLFSFTIKLESLSKQKVLSGSHMSHLLTLLGLANSLNEFPFISQLAQLANFDWVRL